MSSPTKETTKSKVFAGLSIRKPKSSCQFDNENQGVLHANTDPASLPKIKYEEKARMPPAVATESKAAIFPCFRRNKRVTIAESKGNSNKLSATCII
jgi:hypothetical protein